MKSTGFDKSLLCGIIEYQGRAEDVKVELLYMEGCPNWERALEDIRHVLIGKGLPGEVILTQVSSQSEAEDLRFLGSPTIRINDTDIEWDIPEDGPFQLTPRTYWVEDVALGSPPREWMDAAIDVLA